MTTRLIDPAYAWKALRWILDAHASPQLEKAVAAVFESSYAHVGIGSVTLLRGDPVTLRAHVSLSPEQRLRIARQTITAGVLPAAKTLFALRRSTEPGASRPGRIVV